MATTFCKQGASVLSIVLEYLAIFLRSQLEGFHLELEAKLERDLTIVKSGCG
jgi:hypothetical protein